MQNYRLAMLLLLSCLTARAQTPTATLTGRVTDSSGASLPGAVIQVRNLNTNEARIGESSLEGDYTFAGLMPGTYEVTFESRGFKRARESVLELQIDQAARLDIALQPGDIIESVEVTAELPVLNSENAVKGDVITSQEIVEMPLDGRDFADLAFLVPGVSRRAQGGSGSAFAINGARGDNTNFVIDGFNDRNIRGAGVQVRPPIDAMQEFKMQVSNYPAEYGQLAGGVMNMVLKTGGNAFHGAVFEFLRNDRLDARKFFDESKSKLRRNQFGGTLYGPLVIPRLYNGRNRTFFLLAWESYRQVLGATRLGRVPTALEREGDFSRTVDVSGQALYLRDPLTPGACTAEDRTACFPENRIPASRLHPVAAKLIPYYPLENRPSAVNNYLVNANDSDRWDNFAVKLDQRFGNDNLSFRFLQRRNDLSNPFEGSDLGTFGILVSQAQTLTGF
ncbi:MAG: TonB-dependent receptor, partial [Acidobacteria bacterium]|nr:TonB-dependent receptor [Acidobacteriota bacterium]